MNLIGANVGSSVGLFSSESQINEDLNQKKNVKSFGSNDIS